jgi:hypothetical protein
LHLRLLEDQEIVPTPIVGIFKLPSIVVSAVPSFFGATPLLKPSRNIVIPDLFLDGIKRQDCVLIEFETNADEECWNASPDTHSTLITKDIGRLVFILNVV